MPSASLEDQELATTEGVKPAAADQRLSPKLSNPKVVPPPKKRTATSVPSRGSGINETTRKANTKVYSPVSLLDKWRLQQAIFADRDLSPTAKIVAGVLLDCLNCQSGKCCPSLAYLAARIGRKRRVVSAAIAQLRKCWLTSRGRRGSSVYHFAFDRLQQHEVQEPASHQSEGVRKSAYLGAQYLAHEDAQETAHLNTGNLESGNGNQDIIPPGDPPTPRATTKDQKQPRARKSRLPEDWTPSELDIEAALKFGLSEDAIPREALKFQNHHVGKGTLMLDWHRAWQNWCINAVEWGRPKGPNVNSSRGLVEALLDQARPDRWGQS